MSGVGRATQHTPSGDAGRSRRGQSPPRPVYPGMEAPGSMTLTEKERDMMRNKSYELGESVVAVAVAVAVAVVLVLVLVLVGVCV
jgi:hypothetical protein